MDVFKRHDLTDPLEDTGETLWAAKLGYTFGESNIELVWLPTFEEDEMPYNPESRWFFLPRTQNVLGVGTVNVSYLIDYSKLPGKDLSSSQFGIRYSGRNEGFDYSFSYAYSIDRTPVSYLSSILYLNPVTKLSQVSVSPVYNRNNVIGFDCAIVISGIGVKSELAKIIPENSEYLGNSDESSYCRFNMGFDRDFGRVIANLNVFLIIQYLYDSAYTSENVSVSHFFRHAVAGRLELKFSEWVMFEMKTFNDLEFFDSILQPSFTWKGVENVSVVLGADILQGSSIGFFGRFKDNNRLKIETKMLF